MCNYLREESGSETTSRKMLAKITLKFGTGSEFKGLEHSACKRYRLDFEMAGFGELLETIPRALIMASKNNQPTKKKIFKEDLGLECLWKDRVHQKDGTRCNMGGI